nr:MAG TPA: hypothetical protein [Caudoviricetes sp.]
MRLSLVSKALHSSHCTRMLKIYMIISVKILK